MVTNGTNLPSYSNVLGCAFSSTLFPLVARYPMRNKTKIPLLFPPVVCSALLGANNVSV